MADMNATTVQRLFRTQIQGVTEQPQAQDRSVRNVQMQHQDTTGMGFAGQPEPQQKANQPQQVRTPITVGKKIGRNEKVMVKSPDGKQIEIKYKKLQHYLNQGFTQV